jgi:hypothetical protein
MARAGEAVTAAGSAVSATSFSGEPLAADDVSWLFPPPRTVQDLDNGIAIADLTAPDPKNPSIHNPIWPAAAFAKFIENADATRIANAGIQVELPSDAHDIKAWRVAGLRIDPGAPGVSSEIVGQFGQSPQLRFILQPVSVLPGGRVQVHDVAAHVIYSFLAAPPKPLDGCPLGLAQPDTEAFHRLALDFASLRDELANGRFSGKKVVTAGRLLGVHPGLADSQTAKPLRDALVAVLERNLTGQRLTAMALMGLNKNAPEPWVFQAMALQAGVFVSAPGPALDGAQFAEALGVLPSTRVSPTPAPNNLNPITCKFGGAVPVPQRRGLATTALFKLGDSKLTNPAKIAAVKETVDLIADPTRSHFFNTDCVSCHTDTRRTLDLLSGASIPGVDPAVLPKEKWNVRNFGWFPSFLRKTLEATATRRAASETGAVVNFINSKGLAKP